MIDRRNLLRGALLGAGMSAFPRTVLAQASRAASLGKPFSGNQKLLVVFLRGGNDGVNTVIPQGDTTYTGPAGARPTLGITNGISLPRRPYSRLNPNLARLVPIDAAANLAMIHQVGSPYGDRSHFKAMDMFETAAQGPISVGAVAAKSGFVPPMMEFAGIPVAGATNMPAALTISGLMQKMFNSGGSDQVSAHVRNLGVLSPPFPMDEVGITAASSLHGAEHYVTPANDLDGQLGYNLVFGHATTEALESLNFAPQFAATNRFPLEASELASLAGSHPDAAVLPTYDPKGKGFLASAEQALTTLIQAPDVRIAGVEFGGWDTHANQAPIHENLMRYLGWGLRDIYDAIDEAAMLDEITVLVVSEFGRTAKENGGAGTDHGAGGVFFAIGGRAVRGTWNVHSGSPGLLEFGAFWLPLLPGSSDPQYVDATPVATDLRDVLAEVAFKIFQVPLNELDEVIDGYPASTAGFLNFLS